VVPEKAKIGQISTSWGDMIQVIVIFQKSAQNPLIKHQTQVVYDNIEEVTWVSPERSLYEGHQNLGMWGII
jgi:hypothetical protein